MKIMMRLVSDAVFGNGNSVPGGEDIAVLHDSHGFPKYKGSTFKGIFREELINLLLWKGCSEEEAIATAKICWALPEMMKQERGSWYFQIL